MNIELSSTEEICINAGSLEHTLSVAQDKNVTCVEFSGLIQIRKDSTGLVTAFWFKSKEDYKNYKFFFYSDWEIVFTSDGLVD